MNQIAIFCLYICISLKLLFICGLLKNQSIVRLQKLIVNDSLYLPSVINLFVEQKKNVQKCHIFCAKNGKVLVCITF